jgi:hypothetical protein
MLLFLGLNNFEIMGVRCYGFKIGIVVDSSILVLILKQYGNQFRSFLSFRN